MYLSWALPAEFRTEMHHAVADLHSPHLEICTGSGRMLQIGWAGLFRITSSADLQAGRFAGGQVIGLYLK